MHGPDLAATPFVKSKRNTNARARDRFIERNCDFGPSVCGITLVASYISQFRSNADRRTGVKTICQIQAKHERQSTRSLQRAQLRLRTFCLRNHIGSFLHKSIPFECTVQTWPQHHLSNPSETRTPEHAIAAQSAIATSDLLFAESHW